MVMKARSGESVPGRVHEAVGQDRGQERRRFSMADSGERIV